MSRPNRLLAFRLLFAGSQNRGILPDGHDGTPNTRSLGMQICALDSQLTFQPGLVWLAEPPWVTWSSGRPSQPQVSGADGTFTAGQPAYVITARSPRDSDGDAQDCPASWPRLRPGITAVTVPLQRPRE